MKRLTAKQQQIYDYIALSVQERGYPPSVREIGEAVGLKSPSTVHFHLKALERDGLLEKDAGKGRAISLRGHGDEPDKVPVLGNVAAGSPILAEELVEEYISFDTGGTSGEHFALRVRGESMVNAGILPGDLVVVHKQPTAQSGEIVVALLEDEATVKRLSRKNGTILLMPENAGYEPIDGTDAEIMGRVVAVLRYY